MFTDCSMKRNICWWMAAENWTWTTVGQHLEVTQCWVSLWKMRIFGICARNVSLGNCSVLCLVLLPFFHWLICVWMSKPWNLLVLSSSFSAAEHDWSSYNLCSLLSSKHNWKDFWCVWEAALEWGWAEGLKWNSGSWNVWDWPSSQSCAAKEHCARACKELLQTCCWGTFPFPTSGCAGTKCLYFYFKVPPLLLPHFTWCFRPLESLGLLSITHGTGSSSEFSFSFDSSCAEGKSLDWISIYL